MRPDIKNSDRADKIKGIKMRRQEEEEFNVQIGRRLTLLRQSKKMSLEYLGAILGVSHQQVHKYETGESPLVPKRIQICAKIFDVPIGYFYGEDQNIFHQPKFDKSILTIAAEVHELPEDIRKGIYHLSRQINKAFSNDGDEDKQEQVA